MEEGREKEEGEGERRNVWRRALHARGDRAHSRAARAYLLGELVGEIHKLGLLVHTVVIFE